MVTRSRLNHIHSLVIPWPVTTHLVSVTLCWEEERMPLIYVFITLYALKEAVSYLRDWAEFIWNDDHIEATLYFVGHIVNKLIALPLPAAHLMVVLLSPRFDKIFGPLMIIRPGVAMCGFYWFNKDWESLWIKGGQLAKTFIYLIFTESNMFFHNCQRIPQLIRLLSRFQSSTCFLSKSFRGSLN